MRKYEATFIFEPEEEVFKTNKETVTKELEKAGAKLLSTTDMGERELAYEIKKKSKGHYLLFEIETNPESLKPLEKTFKLQAGILKYLFVKKN
ncbi:MAG: 30S ribosomal protein S6 [Spirochaetales bacterium]|nr:30S ribosomal protein S6 [Spirochaetales bacterium]